MFTEQGDVYKVEAVTYDACSYCHWVPVLHAMISSSPYFLVRMPLCLEPVEAHTREAGWPAQPCCLLPAGCMEEGCIGLTFPQGQMSWSATESNLSHPALGLSKKRQWTPIVKENAGTDVSLHSSRLCGSVALTQGSKRATPRSKATTVDWEKKKMVSRGWFLGPGKWTFRLEWTCQELLHPVLCLLVIPSHNRGAGQLRLPAVEEITPGIRWGRHLAQCVLVTRRCSKVYSSYSVPCLSLRLTNRTMSSVLLPHPNIPFYSLWEM